MKEVPVLFERLRASKKRPKAGDVFAYRIKDYPKYGFGRVMRDDAVIVASHKELVIVIYKAFSPSPHDIPKLDHRRLLLPPIKTGNLFWEVGCFMTVGHIPLSKRERERRYCFRDDTYVDGDRYYDEYERPLERPIRPCGDLWEPSPHALICDIARALGVPVPDLSPPEPDPTERQMQKVAKQASKLDVDKCTTPGLRRALKQLLDDLEQAGRKHEELYDTDVREAMYEALFRAFVLQEEGYKIPDVFCMFSAAGHSAVRKALARFVKAARAEAAQAGRRLNTPAKRLCALEDPAVESRDGEGFDTFFGALLE